MYEKTLVKLGNLENSKKSFLHCQIYTAITFSEDLDTRFHAPHNNAGFYTETAASNEI